MGPWCSCAGWGWLKPLLVPPAPSLPCSCPKWNDSLPPGQVRVALAPGCQVAGRSCYTPHFTEQKVKPRWGARLTQCHTGSSGAPGSRTGFFVNDGEWGSLGSKAINFQSLAPPPPPGGGPGSPCAAHVTLLSPSTSWSLGLPAKDGCSRACGGGWRGGASGLHLLGEVRPTQVTLEPRLRPPSGPGQRASFRFSANKSGI